MGPPTDVWALGVLLYLALTDLWPFDGTGLNEILTRVASASPTRPRGLDGSIPRSLEALCLRCLQRDPARRPADAGVFLRELEAARRGVAPASPRSWVGIAAAGVLLLAGATTWAQRPDPAPPPSAPEPATHAPPSPPTPGEMAAEPAGEEEAPTLLGRLHEDPAVSLRYPRRGEDQGLALGEDAVWLGLREGVVRVPRDQLAAGAGEVHDVPGRVKGVAALGDAGYVLDARESEGELHLQRVAGGELHPVWSARGELGKYVGLLAWRAADGQGRLLVVCWAAIMLCLDPSGAEVVEVVQVPFPANVIRSTAYLPGTNELALTGDGGRLFPMAAVFDAEHGTLRWTADLPAVSDVVAPLDGDAIQVGVRAGTVFAVRGDQQAGGEGALFETELPVLVEAHAGAVKGLAQVEGWIYSLSWGSEEPDGELKVWERETMRQVQRLKLPREKGGHLVWDPTERGLWVTSYQGATLRRVRTAR